MGPLNCNDAHFSKAPHAGPQLTGGHEATSSLLLNPFLNNTELNQRRLNCLRRAAPLVFNDNGGNLHERPRRSPFSGFFFVLLIESAADYQLPPAA